MPLLNPDVFPLIPVVLSTTSLIQRVGSIRNTVRKLSNPMVTPSKVKSWATTGSKEYPALLMMIQYLLKPSISKK